MLETQAYIVTNTEICAQFSSVETSAIDLKLHNVQFSLISLSYIFRQSDIKSQNCSSFSILARHPLYPSRSAGRPTLRQGMTVTVQRSFFLS